MAKTIGEMTEADLARFIQGAVRAQLAQLPISLTLQNLTTTKRLTVSDELQLSPQAIAYLHQVLGV